MSKTHGDSMLLINASWQGHPSFKMIPVTKDCPYTECLWDPANKLFVVVSTIKKTSLHMLPKLDQMGDPEVLKTGKRPNGKVLKEQRVSLETYQEYYVENADDAKALIEMFATNADTFGYEEIMSKDVQENAEKVSLIQ